MTRTGNVRRLKSDAALIDTILPLSDSRLHTFEECGAKGEKKHIQRIPEPENVYQLIGRGSHRLSAEYASHCLERGTVTDLDWLARAGVNLPSDAVGEGIRRALLALAEIEFPVFEDATFAVERELALDAKGNPADYYGEDCFWRGKADLIRLLPRHDHLIVKDWKNTWKLPPVTSPPPNQLLDYGYAAVKCCWPMDREPPANVTLELIFLSYPAVRSWTLTWHEIANRPTVMRQRAEAIMADGFKAKVGDHCGLCAYTGQCDAYLKLYGEAQAEMRPWQTDAEARGGILQWQLLKGRIAQLEAQARAWCEERGPVDVGDGCTVGYRTTQKQRITNGVAILHAVRDDLHVPGPEILAALSVSKGDVEPLLRKAGVKGKAIKEWWDAQEAQGRLETRVESVFGFQKDGD